eukprot:Plantae.Rhodophyta-Purpureofilum_apyrenoidigerum.ctg38869.p1 GENE.Plantae.Rhodophyta-Purpureofilum_apyrenoidigerum.ctg38869~~Plantae.Rhodophyta-Purpureofilum_apyrenoidigerum.ctg38869.p1  ORF type:complete len:364 (-),score=42.66 Plantae.Rhodophyta-Purpureofilum_apyrenoidigerum.ctg38869:142-1170(-)
MTGRGAMKEVGFVVNGVGCAAARTARMLPVRRNVGGRGLRTGCACAQRARMNMTRSSEVFEKAEGPKEASWGRKVVRQVKEVGAAVVKCIMSLVDARTKRMRLLKFAKVGIMLPIMLATVTTAPPPVAISSTSNMWRAFSSAFGVVFVSEFGDKSMFATALMAMRYKPSLVLIGALGALTVMTIIACFLGHLGQFLPPVFTHYASIALFAYFGIRMLLQARDLPDTPGAGGEADSAKQMVAQFQSEGQKNAAILARVSSLIFVAEWLDRSMIATMALAASGNTPLVFLGATFANIICTAIAVLGAALVSTKISERTVAIIAGVLFEFFAVYTFFEPQFENDQ